MSKVWIWSDEKKELESLHRLAKSGRSEFVVVYGRRRIGKTFLVRQAFAGAFTFSHTGVENVNLAGQLRAFTSSLKDAGVKSVPRLKTWFDAFDALKELILKSSATKKIIFLDELPWMDTAKSSFVPALEFFWNVSVIRNTEACSSRSLPSMIFSYENSDLR